MQEYEFFENYVKNFDMSIEWIKYKYEHTMRVVNYALEISDSINLSKEERKEIEVCALFHDIARFPQYQEFKTFNDAKTFDHGDKGAEILEENGYHDEVLLNVVRCHNKFAIPEEYDEKTKLYSRIIRDADKIDILDQVYNECTTSNYILPKEIIDVFKRNETLKKAVKLDCDGNLEFMLKHLAFIFDLNYKYSFKFIRDKNIINRKLDSIYKNNKYDWVEEIRNICNEFIERRLNDEGIR